MIMEVDILLIKQIELSYLPKVRRLMYLLSVHSPAPTNVSQLSKDIQISRATVMNYIKSLKDARLINMLYRVGEEFPKNRLWCICIIRTLYIPIGRFRQILNRFAKPFL